MLNSHARPFKKSRIRRKCPSDHYGSALLLFSPGRPVKSQPACMGERVIPFAQDPLSFESDQSENLRPRAHEDQRLRSPSSLVLYVDRYWDADKSKRTGK